MKRTMLNVFGGAMRYQVLNHIVDKGSLILHISVEYPLYENHKNGSVVSETWGRIEEFGTSSIRTDYGQAWKTAFTDALKREQLLTSASVLTFTTRLRRQRMKPTLTPTPSQHGLKLLKTHNNQLTTVTSKSFGKTGNCSAAQKG